MTLSDSMSDTLNLNLTLSGVDAVRACVKKDVCFSTKNLHLTSPVFHDVEPQEGYQY